MVVERLAWLWILTIFYQDLYVAQQIYSDAPERHIDVGSRIDGFVAHVASFREIEIIDIRQISLSAKNIKVHRMDITKHSETVTGITDSISCLHVLEHIGLGRYGDELNPDGWAVALANLVSMVKQNGRIYISIPVGPQRIEFNAHRVFHPMTIFNELSRHSTVLDIAIIDDSGVLITCGVDKTFASHIASKVNYGCLIVTSKKD